MSIVVSQHEINVSLLKGYGHSLVSNPSSKVNLGKITEAPGYRSFTHESSRTTRCTRDPRRAARPSISPHLHSRSSRRIVTP